jgi:hypothetical protein
VERPAFPGPSAAATVKRQAAGVSPGQPPSLKKSKVAAKVNTAEEETAASGLASMGTWALKRSRSKPTPPPVEAETFTPTGLEYVVVMSGNPLECGICFEAFDDADDTGAAARHMFWPCQHEWQCGECASRVWKTPPKRRRCPWCASKIDSRPRPLKPYV